MQVFSHICVEAPLPWTRQPISSSADAAWLRCVVVIRMATVVALSLRGAAAFGLPAGRVVCRLGWTQPHFTLATLSRAGGGRDGRGGRA